jgi:hypothetical protein
VKLGEVAGLDSFDVSDLRSSSTYILTYWDNTTSQNFFHCATTNSKHVSDMGHIQPSKVGIDRFAYNYSLAVQVVFSFTLIGRSHA